MTQFVSGCTPVRYFLLLLIGFMIGAPQVHAVAQGVSADTLGSFARPAAPAIMQHTSWLVSSGVDSGAKDFTVNPTTAGIVVGLSLAVIFLANIRLRPRYAR